MGNPKENEEEVMEQLVALGYIDPGSGSSLWQMVLAKVFTMGDSIKTGLKKVFGIREAKREED